MRPKATERSHFFLPAVFPFTVLPRQRSRSTAKRNGGWASFLALTLFVLFASSASAQTISGTAFSDNNGDGSKAATELGRPGIIITAFGTAGTIASQTASCGTSAISIPANPPGIPSPINVAACAVGNVGQYTLSGLAAGTPFRLEAFWSDALLFNGAQGSTAVQFADGGNTGVDFGVNFPEDYCQNNPRILAGCYPLLLSPFGPPPWDPTRTDDLIVSWPYNTRFATAANAEVHTGSYTQDATYGDLGSIFGVAIHRSTRLAFFSAISAPFWPSGGAGMGGIYTADYSGPGDTYVPSSAALFVDLDPLVDLSNQFPVMAGDLNRFGEQGLGGIDFSADDEVLWAINMGAGSLLRIDVGDPPVAPGAADIQEISITGAGCTSGRFRPGPVVSHRGNVFIGGVCDASTGSLANLEAKVLEYDGATFTVRLTASLGFSVNQIFPLASFNMAPWSPGDTATAPEPIMTNLAFDDDGSIVLGLMPRVSYNAFAQTAGYMLRAQVDASGNFTLESGAASGPYTSAADTTWAGVGFNPANPPLSEGPGGGYFFENGIFSGAFAPPPFVPVNAATYHSTLFSAGLTVVPGTGEVAAGFADPVSLNSFGVRILDRDDGTGLGGLQFGGLKVALVSEVDALCQSPPLEIGNRVWCDTDINGVQDPDETSTSFPSIDVVLTCGSDAPVTKSTGATGRYVFTDADYSVVNGTPIPRMASCTLSIDTTGANGTGLTNACGSTDRSPVDNGGAGPGSDLRDSDGADGGGGLSEISFNTGENGENDHSYDFGFGSPPIIEDWGDAPDTYGTSSGASGPRHTLVADFQLGSAVDSEMSGVPSGGADGDDTTGSPDDEDGVSFPGGMAMGAACEATSLTVNLTNGAALGSPQVDAWIDFNRDGVFADPAEHLFGGSAMALASGDNVIPVTIPCSAVPGASYARFRLSNGEQLGPTGGPATAGEVEDYTYLLKADFGDAPDTYGTTLAANGPRHGVLAGFRLGALEDAEGNGQPTPGADGDDTSGTDDEDGVSFGAGGAMAPACSTSNPLTVTLDNTAGQANALLDAWIDWNGDGDFDHPAEHLFSGTSSALASGANNLTYDVPCNAVAQAVSYARFRLSSAGGLTPLGAIANGEIEDYTFQIKGVDFGDAPDTYGTTASNTGARHTVIPGFSLGAAEDGEPDGQPNAAADGDDTNGTPDDEDGVTFPGGMAMAPACSTGNAVTVSMTRFISGPPAQLDAWIDWNGDGDFDHPAEHLFSGTSTVLGVGSNNLTYDVPCDAVAQAVSYARFRLSTAGSLPPTGATNDGEVEDYAFQIKRLDFGDAPDTYGTTVAANGPAHNIVPGFLLGALEDTESDGQPNATATGDDTTDQADEDGVTFPAGMAMAGACTTGNDLTIDLINTAGIATARLDAWIDWNGDGDFDHPAEHLFAGTSATLNPGPNALTYDVPCNAVEQATSYARFRLSSTGSLTPIDAGTAPIANGEVEDYTFQVKGVDFGDAPDSYDTTVAAGGPRHTVIPGFRLGTEEDSEAEGQPNAGADGDDTNGTDDEDGITFPGAMAMAGACTTGNDLTARLTNSAGIATARLDAWIDWNGDGDFDHPAEHLFGGTTAVLSAGDNALTYDVPCSAVEQAVSYARFRLSSTGSVPPSDGVGNDPVADGEVEDYTFQVKGVDFGDAPDTFGTTSGANGPHHTIIPGYRLGAEEDSEPDGQPNATADGDDTNGAPDDEDGVTFPGGMAMTTACSTGNGLTVNLTNTPGIATALLDAWIDFNADGDFDHPAEHLFSGTSTALAVGANSLSYDVPCDAVAQGVSYARFRLSSTGSLLPTDAPAAEPVADGEVEDYTIQIKGVDYGDAPDTYGTLRTSQGPSHVTLAGFTLGNLEDGEPDGQPSPGADGDDTTAQADEDGVTFPGGMAMGGACEDTSLDVALVNSAAIATPLFDAWIDFNGDGDFDHPAEHLFGGTSAALVAGSNSLNYTVPCDSVSGASYARFRLSSTGGLAPIDATGGSVADGEVEDYAFLIKGVDLGDAPDTYGTTLAANGPAHTIVPGFLLGALEDTESDGQPNAAADGDDTTDEADEDGVTFAGGMAMAGACTTGNGLTVNLTNTASIATALLDAWIDWNGDGDFDHPAEHLFGGTTAVLSVGANALSYDVPCNAVEQAVSYARFRLSSGGSLPPTDAAGGPAADGEVEDYTFQVKGIDFGDAPDTYGTVTASDGPRHTVIPGYRLGTEEDSEADGQPNVTADGDDTNGTADEDGIAFANGMAMAGACTVGNALDVALTNTAGIATARLDAWIDWNGDGDFDHPAEHLFGGSSATLSPGPNALTYDVPCNAVPQGVSYARFRLSSTGSLAPTTGAAAEPVADGEIEDYTFQVKGVDFGDAPDTYQTTILTGGPSHTILPGYTLGMDVDTDPDGQPTPNADGDDVDVDGDDEDGIAFAGGMPMAQACAATDVQVTLTNTAGVGSALVDAWIDFNGDGDFDHPAEHLFGGTSAPVTAGANTLPYTVPCDVVAGDTYSRFRLSSTGGLTPANGASGPVADGEVEDYAFLLKGLDWGDAPAPYSTTSADNGPWHVLVPTDNPTLGATVDGEADGQPDTSHLGDDNTGTPDDEDGVSLPLMVLPGGVFDVDVTALNSGVLNAWVDFNGNGIFGDDPAEQIATDLPLTAGTTAIPGLTVPPTAPDGTVCARFRYSTQTGVGPTGGAPDGEIEDYGITILPEDAMIGAAKDLDTEAVLDNGDGTFTFTYQLMLRNFGNIELEEVQATTDLATAFEAALSFTVDLVTASDNLTVNGGYDGDGDIQLLSGTDTLDVDEEGFIDLTVTVAPGQNGGPYFCSAEATATSTAGTDVMDMSQDGDDPDPDDNDNPTDDDEPTPVTFEVFEIIEIPTLEEWGMVLMTLLLLLLGTRALRRRRA